MILKLNEYLGHKEEIIYKIANELGYKLIKKLGGGSYGTAFLTSDNKVFKVTYSSGDAGAADSLINKKCEYLANCYNVYETNEFHIIVMEKLDTDNVNKDKLKKAMSSSYKFNHSSSLKTTLIKNIYNIFSNSYVNDFIEIYKEAKKYGVGVDTQNIGNFGLKNGHLAAFDLCRFKNGFENLEKIKELEKFYDEITKQRDNTSGNLFGGH